MQPDRFGDNMLTHAMCAIELLTETHRDPRQASASQHLEWSERILSEMRILDKVDLSILVGKCFYEVDTLGPEAR
jgi:hypothetical protein